MTSEILLASTRKPRTRTKYMPSAKSLANLIKYKPGQNGNPKPGNSLKAVLLNALGQPLKEPPKDAPVRDHIVYATLKGALACEPTSAHLKEVWDRADGKLPDSPPAVTTIDNRQVNIYVTSERAKELTENAGRRLLNRMNSEVK